MKRPPAVAGQFYQAEAGRLAGQVRAFMTETASRHRAKAVLVPHAGLIYSGPVAGAVYSSIEVPDTFVLIGPNHTGLGPRVSLMAEGSWQIPTGEVEIDSALAGRIARRVPLAQVDNQAHMFEHSLEVQLPFIRHLSERARIVPLAVMSASLRELEVMGEGLAGAVREAGYPVVVAASSDMSHFVPDSTARQKDRLALDRILELDHEGLYSVVRAEGITMCGYLPAVMTVVAARALGAKEAVLVKYATSAEASGDYDSVVGYAGVVIK